MPDDLAALHARIEALFDVPVAVAVTDPRLPQPAPFAAEAAHVAGAIATRQREFAAGRAMARAAMARLAGTPVPHPILPGADRAPCWPDGWQGSISHKSGLCAAVVGRDGAHLGLDMEEDVPLNEDLIATICSESEIMRIEGSETAHLAKLIFCAKEAAYKAQYPITRSVFGFDRLDVRLDLNAQRFQARFTAATGPFAPGDALSGRFCREAGHLVTGVAIGHSAVRTI